MYKGKGIGINDNVTIGNIHLISNEKIVISNETVSDIEKELDKYINIRELAKNELTKLYDKAVNEIGETDAMIIDIQRMLIDDLDYIDYVEAMIKNEKKNLSYAISVAGEYFSNLFSTMEDDYMKERAFDIKDVSDRLLKLSLGITADKLSLHSESIIVADNLTPSDTIKLDKNLVLGIIVARGSATCHTAILAKTLGIPAIVGADINIDKELNGKLAIIDASENSYIIDPDTDIIDLMKKKIANINEDKKKLDKYKGLSTITLSGQKINLYANIGNPNEVDLVNKNDAEGIGLYRSEFLFIGRDNFPSEDEQFKAYSEVVKGMNNKKVILRTLDIGSDKKASYINLSEEENPALGIRGIRLSKIYENEFKIQVRAALRAACFGNLSIMLPMVSNEEEVDWAKSIIEKAKLELDSENKKYKDIDLGIMIETPAAALIADSLAKKVSFFSVGTNDLTQYTLAADRMNPSIEAYDAHHESIYILLKIIVNSAHKNNIWAGICGELASNVKAVPRLIEMGYDELSVSPANVLKIREIINNIK